MLRLNVDDIDKDDCDNPRLDIDYVSDIYVICVISELNIQRTMKPRRSNGDRVTATRSYSLHVSRFLRQVHCIPIADIHASRTRRLGLPVQSIGDIPRNESSEKSRDVIVKSVIDSVDSIVRACLRCLLHYDVIAGGTINKSDCNRGGCPSCVSCSVSPALAASCRTGSEVCNVRSDNDVVLRPSLPVAIAVHCSPTLLPSVVGRVTRLTGRPGWAHGPQAT